MDADRGGVLHHDQETFLSWYGKLKMAPALSAVASDSYFVGSGRMLVKLISIFTLVDHYFSYDVESVEYE